MDLPENRMVAQTQDRDIESSEEIGGYGKTASSSSLAHQLFASLHILLGLSAACEVIHALPFHSHIHLRAYRLCGGPGANGQALSTHHANGALRRADPAGEWAGAAQRTGYRGRGTD